jgi:hypothetical protein
MEMEVRPVETHLQDDVKIGQGAVGSHEKAPPEHRVDPPNPDVDTVNFGLRIVFHDGPAYQGGQRLALPSPRFEMLSSMRTTAANTNITGMATKAQNASRPQPKALHLRLQSPPGLPMSQVDKPRQRT